MSITGNLRTLEFSELLQWLAHGRKTGALLIERENGERQVWFDEGRIIGSASISPDHHLSRMLVDHGLVDQATMARALKLQEATQILLGRVLVTLGTLGEGNLRRLLQSKTEDTIYELFTWPDGDFRFVGDGVPDQPMIPISLDVTNLVLEGMHRIDERRRTESRGAEAAPTVPTEALETQIIQPIRDIPKAPPPPEDPPPETAAPETSPPVTETDETPAEVQEVPPGPTAVEADPDVEDSGSPELHGFYQTIPAKKMSRKMLYGIIGGAAVLLLVIGGVFYFSSGASPEPKPEPVAVAEVVEDNLDPSLDPALAAGEEELEAGALTGAVGEDVTAEGGVDQISPIVAPDEPPEPEDAEESIAEMEARARQLADDRAALREDELRQEYESELDALRAELEDAKIEVAAKALEEATAPEEPVVAVAESTPGTEAVIGDEPVAAPIQAPAEETPPPEPEEPKVKRGDLVSPGAGVDPARLLDPPKPRYPPAARRLRRAAVVDVRVLVDEDGKVAEVERRGKKVGMGFDEAAMDAARKTTWSAATKDGVSVRMWVDLRIDFQP